MLSSIGIGAATVDTKVEKDEFVLGEEVRGVIEIKGGSRAQEVDEVYIDLATRHGVQADPSRTLPGEWLDIERFPIAPARRVEPGSHEEIPFSFRLPYDTPLSIGHSLVWLRTGLDVDKAFDPSDDDLITIRPNPTIRTVLDALEGLGLQLWTTSVERLPERLRRRLSSGQEIKFVATTGEFKGRLSELEVLMYPSEDSVDLVMEVDRRGSGGESSFKLTFSESETSQGTDQVAETLAEAIRQHL